MKMIVLFSTFIVTTFLAPDAGAGAATGMPIPFIWPYPDLGPSRNCLWRGEISPRHSARTSSRKTGAAVKEP
jgi:hypothetical protein